MPAKIIKSSKLRICLLLNVEKNVKIVSYKMDMLGGFFRDTIKNYIISDINCSNCDFGCSVFPW